MPLPQGAGSSAHAPQGVTRPIKPRYQLDHAGKGTALRPDLLRRHQPCRLYARHHQGDMAARRRLARLSRWRGDRRIGRRLSRSARENRGAWQYQAARPSRYHRGRERGRDQRHLSRARARDGQIARSADRTLAERRRRRQPARPRCAALVGDDEILGSADRRLGDEAARQRDRPHGRRSDAGRGAREAVALRARAGSNRRSAARPSTTCFWAPSTRWMRARTARRWCPPNSPST